MVHPAGQRVARQVGHLLPGEPRPEQRVQVQRRVVGQPVHLPPRRVQLHHAHPADHLADKQQTKTRFLASEC